MNIYGDRGNIITLVKRSKWRDIEVEIKEINLEENPDFELADILFMGGGQDRGQKIITPDLLRLGPKIKKAVEGGIPGLVVCGGYQLFGKYFKTHTGEELYGIKIFDAYTVAGSKRLIGNVIVETQFGKIVGFENHSGKTYLATRDKRQETRNKNSMSHVTKPLGTIIKGFGNNGKDNLEGAIYKNLIGTYLHGPILPKNPALADWLISTALKRKYGEDIKFEPLSDHEEERAWQSAFKRAYKNVTSHL